MMHRKSRQTRRLLAVVVSALAALVLVTGAIALSPATAESGLSPLELAQVTQANCQVLLAHATTSAARTRARACIADQQVIITALSGSPSPTPSATQSPSPSPSPTVQPSPTVTPTATTAPPTTPPATTPPPSPSPTGTQTNCVANPGACGYPDALSTGPAGALTVSTRTQYATAGETIVNTEIRGCVEVRAANVTFRNAAFIGSCFWTVRVYSGSVTIEDAEISCQDTPGSSGFVNTSSSGGTAVLRRVDIHDCENGLSVPGNTTVADSWIHSLYDQGSAHTDGSQFDQGASNIRYEHNTIDARGNTTSAIIMWDEGDPQNANVTIVNNLMAGGSFTLYCGRSGTAVNVAITNNRFGPFTFGYANACNSGGEVWSGNVRDSDGAVLAAA
jgi:hypothetical protein